MSKPFSNNATSKYLGYVYQVLIVIEQCCEAGKNQTIWIESFGDIYNGTVSTEVKHHIDKTNLVNNSVDFWKTFKNLVNEDTSSFDLLVLHTTATIQKDSIFENWNDITKADKFKRLKEHTPVQSVEIYYKDTIEKFLRKDLLVVLDKLIIKSSQMSVKDKWENLIASRHFLMIKDEYKEDAFQWLYGYVHKQAIKEHSNWHIKINDFDEAFRLALSKYTQGRIPFPAIKKTEVGTEKKDFNFIQEMKNIELKESAIQNAVSDYLRANTSEIKLLKYEPITMAESLEEYDESVLERLESLKMEFCEEIKVESIDSETSKKVSRNLFYKSINSIHQNISGVDDTQKYYRDGRIHHNVNKNKFKWKYSKDDLL